MAVISVWSQSRESTHGSAGQALLEKCSPRTMFFRINENVHGRDHAPLTVVGSPKKCILFFSFIFSPFFFFFLIPMNVLSVVDALYQFQGLI